MNSLFVRLAYSTMNIYFTEGIILRHRNFRESDRLLTVYTKDHGKLEVVARGSRKITSKLAGNLEPFILTELMVVRGKSFDTVTASETIQYFSAIRADFQKIQLASHYVEIIDNLIKVHHKDLRIFNLIKEVFSDIEKIVPFKEKRAKMDWYFAWRILRYLGFGPELYRCLVCRKRLREKNNYFDFRRGGVVCFDCYSPKEQKASLISPEATKVLRLVREGKKRTVMRLQIKKKLRGELDELTDSFLECILEKKLKTESVARVY